MASVVLIFLGGKMKQELEIETDKESEEQELLSLPPTQSACISEALQMMERNWYAEHGDLFMT